MILHSGLATSRRARASRRGGVLVLALLSVLTVSVMAAAYLQTTASTTRRQVRSVDNKQAFYMAEAGLTEAFAGLKVMKTGNVGSEEEPAVFGDGLFWVVATDLGNDQVRLVSTGMFGSGRATLAVVAERGERSIMSLGIFSEQDIRVGPGTVIDSYDSSEGSYDQQTEGGTVLQSTGASVLGSNGTVTVQSSARAPTEIHGDLTFGPDAQLVLEGDPVIDGEPGAAIESVELPAIEVPEMAPGRGISHASGAPLVVPAGTYSLSYLSLGAESETVLEGPATLILGQLDVGENAELTFDTAAGEIGVIVDGALTLAPTAKLVNPSEKSHSLTIQVTGEEPVSLNASAPLHAVVYAPKAEIQLASGAEVFGALVASSVVFGSGAKLHFDEHLTDMALESSLPRFLSWRILEIAATEGSSVNMDPFQALGVARELLPRPEDAHEDQEIRVVYLDPDGARRTYSGWESRFDWSEVAEVRGLTRNGEFVEMAAWLLRHGQDEVESVLTPTMIYRMLDLPSDADAQTIGNALIGVCPLPDTALEVMIDADLGLSDAQVTKLLVLSSPLNTARLHSVLDLGLRDPNHLQAILMANSPLPDSVKVRAQDIFSEDTGDPAFEAVLR